MHPRGELLPENPAEPERKRELINEFWTALYDEGDMGAASWEALDRLRDRVTAALRKRPPDVSLAESLTARAALLIESRGES